MGEVYKGRDTRLDRTVAIKVLPAHVAADPDRRQRFEREARIISSLDHPHICALYFIRRGILRGRQEPLDAMKRSKMSSFSLRTPDTATMVEPTSSAIPLATS